MLYFVPEERHQCISTRSQRREFGAILVGAGQDSCHKKTHWSSIKDTFRNLKSERHTQVIVKQGEDIMHCGVGKRSTFAFLGLHSLVHFNGMAKMEFVGFSRRSRRSGTGRGGFGICTCLVSILQEKPQSSVLSCPPTGEEGTSIA